MSWPEHSQGSGVGLACGIPQVCQRIRRQALAFPDSRPNGPKESLEAQESG